METLKGISQDGALDPAVTLPAGSGDINVSFTVSPPSKTLKQLMKAVPSEATGLHSSAEGANDWAPGAAQPGKSCREAHIFNNCDGEAGVNLNLSGSTTGLVTPATAAAAAAMSFASFTQQQNRASRWYSQTGIRLGAAVTATAPPVRCCHVCGAPQIVTLQSRDSSQGGNAANVRGSLPGVGTVNNALQSFTAGFRGSLAGFRGSLAGALPGARWGSVPGLAGRLAAQDDGQQEQETGSPRSRFAPKNKARPMPPPSWAETAGAEHATITEVDGKHGPVLTLPIAEDHVATADKYAVSAFLHEGRVQGFDDPARLASARRNTSDSINSSIGGGELSLSGAGTPGHSQTDGGVSDRRHTQDGVTSSSNSSGAGSRLLVWTNAVFSFSGRNRETRRSTSDGGGDPLNHPAVAVPGPNSLNLAGQEVSGFVQHTTRAAAALAAESPRPRPPPAAATAGVAQPAEGHGMHVGGQRQHPGAVGVDPAAALGACD